ncbi:MAG: amidohydrolase family protein [Acidimicrobiales bacterium]|nr:amidohydrolase family protein [Acidimicrobiales bacterium]
MIIDLHAHNPMPALMNQHPFWGPFREVEDEDGKVWPLRIGDWTIHLSTPEKEAALKAGVVEAPEEIFAKRADPAVRIEQMDKAGIDKMVLSITSHCYMYQTEPEWALEYARLYNDESAKYTAPFSDRLYFWAHAPLQDPQAAVGELERAVTQLGAKGLNMGGANFGGLEADSPELYPVWEKACELDVPLWVHGYNQSLNWGERAKDERYEITAIVGMMYDESSLFWNMVCGGVLDQFPELKVIVTHGGGFTPFQLGRFENTNEVLATAKNKKPVREYLSNFWFDPLVHDVPMRRAIIDLIGADQLVYGTNFGGADGTREDLLAPLDMPDEDREKIHSGNAVKLLKL